MRLSRFFTLEEMTASRTATARRILNDPDRAAIGSMRHLLVEVDRLREAWGEALDVSSGFRCAVLDRAVGGSGWGQHVLGEAVDLVPRSRGASALAALCAELGADVDQVIAYAETRHLHVSRRLVGVNRKQFLWCASKARNDFRPWDPRAAPGGSS